MLDDAATRTIALSFEDGPDPVWTPRVLASLEGSGVRATFFVTAPRAAVWPDIVEQISAGGHEVGLHCGRHVSHGDSSEASITRDTEVALGILRSQEVEVRWWLPPCGEVAPFSGDIARRLGLQLVSWSMDPIGDASASTGVVLDRIASQLHPGSIVRVYDGFDESARDDAACRLSLQLIVPLVEHLDALGYVAVPVGEIVSRMVDLEGGASRTDPSLPSPA